MFPKFINIRQHHPARPEILDIPAAVHETIEGCGADMSTLSGKTVGIAVGSRGIKNIYIIVRAAADEVKHAGGVPKVFAAMGSHGGGTPEGQREVLAALGVTEESTGCEIITGVDSVYYGMGENGTEVYANPIALGFDRVILINRIKMHTDFEDITESGIYKLMAVGLGNPKGAGIIHACSHTVGYGAAIRNAGRVILDRLPVIFALAITENWKHETDSIEAILPENLLETEKRILKEVKAGAIALPLKVFDVLIIEQAGKQFSGTTIDTKVVGRIRIAGEREPEFPKIKNIAVLDFTKESHGNAMGLGIADIISRRAYDNINIADTSLTGVTSTCLDQAKIPCVAPDDKTAIETCFRASGITEPENAEMVLIRNTSELEYMAVSMAAYERLSDRDDIEALGEPYELEFSEDGALTDKLPVHDIFIK